MNTKNKRLFITGIPTSGKSYLAKKLASAVGGIAVPLDDFRESLASNVTYKKWTNFYLDVDEEKYLKETNAVDQWKNLVNQSEGLWPAFLEKINSYKSENKPIIFECVNMLPHLAKRSLNFPGIVLIGETFEETFARNHGNPRWGNTMELQELEARAFFYNERPNYKSEAEKYGYPVFESADKAFATALSLLK